MQSRSYNQLKYYHKLINQLKNQAEIKVYCNSEWFKMRPLKIQDNSFRYLLKMLDTELPTICEISPQNQNKNPFDDAEMAHLQHHIEWLRGVLYDNGIIPFDDAEILKNFIKEK